MTAVVDEVGSGPDEARVSVPAFAGIGAGAIHAAAVGAHAEHRILATIFVVLAMSQLATGVTLLMQPRRAVAKAVVAVNGFAVAGWLLTRTVGVWLVAGLGVERPGFADTACALLGAVAVLGAGLLLSNDTRAGSSTIWRPATVRRDRSVPSMLLLLLVVVPAMSSAATHAHEHGGGLAADHAHEAVDESADEVSSIANAGNGVDET
jgi:hypothetical protein